MQAPYKGYMVGQVVMKHYTRNIVYKTIFSIGLHYIPLPVYKYLQNWLLTKSVIHKICSDFNSKNNIIILSNFQYRQYYPYH
jgi:hypothetical protein